MAVQSVSGAVSGIGATTPVDPTLVTPVRSTTRPHGPSTASDGSSVATISPWSKLLNRLESLQAMDPTTFKSAAEKLGTRVDHARAQASGDEGVSLDKLGGAFRHAAKTGDSSALKPALHHHHVHAAKHMNGGTGALLNNLLQEIDGILGPQSASSIDGS